MSTPAEPKQFACRRCGRSGTRLRKGAPKRRQSGDMVRRADMVCVPCGRDLGTFWTVYEEAVAVGASR